MKLYTVEDLTKGAFETPIEICAKSPLEATRKALNAETITRDFSGRSGNIVTRAYGINAYGQRYFIGSYVYNK